MNLYTYDGPVMYFDTCIERRWTASTYAVSVEKARNNLTYRYKKASNRTTNAKISLPGRVVKVQ